MRGRRALIAACWYRWDGGTFIDPEHDLFGIFMVQTPSQRGRIQLGL